MSLFDDVLREGESLFVHEEALDPEWVPKLMPFRDNQQFSIAACIRPLLQGRNGRNCFVFGAPGIGKTAAVKWVLRELEDESEDIDVIYVNCWQKNSMYKIFVDVCEQLSYRFTQNKNTEELFRVIENRVNKRAAVFVFDEIDKVQDVDFLYSILNDIYRKSVVLITNYPGWLVSVEDRVRSRLMPEKLEFKPYSADETRQILRERRDFVFAPGVWDEDAFELVARKASEAGDIRAGLFLLREAGLAAEDESSKRILLKHAESAVAKSSDFSIKDSDDLDEDAHLVLDVVKDAGESKIGELFKSYQGAGGKGTYKTFQRRVEKLSKGGFITTRKVVGGKEGTTTIVSRNKSLDEFS